AAGLGGLVALALAGAPSWTLFPAAAVFGGSYPQPGSLVRARWAHALSGTPLLPTAFSLESVLDEVVFVVGPVLVTVLATAVSPSAGLLVGAAVGGIFGAIEVATVAFTDEHGQTAAAGIVLALLAGGSLLAGLWYG